MAIITYSPDGRKPPDDSNDAPALDVAQTAQIARYAWALYARLDYLTTGAGRMLNDATRQRMLRRMTRDTAIMARIVTPAALSRPSPGVEGGAA